MIVAGQIQETVVKTRPEQFKITDPNERIVAGWASVEIVDLQGDVIPVDVLERAMYKYVDRGGHILYRHSNMPVGKILRWEIREHPELTKQYKKPVYGVWIEAKIFNNYELDNMVWNLIRQGKIKGFSIGGVGKERKAKIKNEDGSETEVDLVTEIELTEISLVEEPANPLAKIEAINWMAKSIDKIIENIQKQESERPPKKWWNNCIEAAREFADNPEAFCGWLWYHGEEEGFGHIRDAFFKSAWIQIQKPFAGFKNFDDCIRHMREEGYDEESARRICGKLYWEYEGRKKKKEIDIEKFIKLHKTIYDYILEQLEKRGFRLDTLNKALAKQIKSIAAEISFIIAETILKTEGVNMPEQKQVEKADVKVEKPKEEKITETVSEPTQEEKSPVLSQVNKEEEEAKTETTTNVDENVSYTAKQEEEKPIKIEEPPKEDIKPGEIKPGIEERVDKLEQAITKLTEIVSKLTDLVTETHAQKVSAEETEKAVAEVTGKAPALGKELKTTEDNIVKRREGKMTKAKKDIVKERILLKAKVRKNEKQIEKTLNVVKELVGLMEEFAKQIQDLKKEIAKLRKQLEVKVETEPEKATVEVKPKEEKPKVEEVPAPEPAIELGKAKEIKKAETPRPEVEVNEPKTTDERVEYIRKILTGQARPLHIYKELKNKYNA